MNKGLETLRRIENTLYNLALDSGIHSTECLDTKQWVRTNFGIEVIEKELKAYEELKKENLVLLVKEKALEIINKKFKISVYYSRHTKTKYEICIEDNDSKFVYDDITEEEYDLLKKVLL